ncbi:MAG: DUF5618 family protein [bacterium]
MRLDARSSMLVKNPVSRIEHRVCALVAERLQFIYMKEALRYLDNAKEILKSIPRENNTYTDIKPVREVFGVAYLAILEAINWYLIEKKGFTKKELPRSIDAYRDALKKHLSVHDGKLMIEFEKLYDGLHIAGYYRGLIYDTQAVKDYLKATKAFIEKIGGGIF